MSKPRVVVMRAPGINCDEETRHAWQLAGADCEIIHLNKFLNNPSMLDGYDALTLPGGFSFGDDVSAGRIFANQLVQKLGDKLRDFLKRDRLILGICNGFQILVKTGLLNAGANDEPCTLAFNACGHFVCRWVSLNSPADKCVFLEANRTYFLPIAHAEGRFVPSESVPPAQQRIALRYVDDTPRVGPANPNASFDDIAALTDSTGRILGMMPHPERFVDRTQHPFWTATDPTMQPDGLDIFRAAVAALR